MAKLRLAHASTHGARKPPGPKTLFFLKQIKFTPKKYLHIFSSYAKILGEKLFRTWEIPLSGSKAKNGEKKRIKKKKKKRRD